MTSKYLALLAAASLGAAGSALAEGPAPTNAAPAADANAAAADAKAPAAAAASPAADASADGPATTTASPAEAKAPATAAAAPAADAPSADPAPATTATAATSEAKAPLTAAAAPASPSASTNAMVNLVRLLVAQKTITPEAGDQLLVQASAEAQSAQATLAAQAPAPEGAVRVPYVPQVVKDEIREQLKAEMYADTKAPSWAVKSRTPGWIDRVKISGDLRFRDQSEFYSKANSSEYVDYAAFNANGPTDINGLTNPAGVPLLNTRENRTNRLSIRARLAVDVRFDDDDRLTAGFRIASGNDSSPVSTTQLLGGGFDKKDIWLDRAFIRIKPVSFASLTFGRMPNPFWSTDLLYDEDLNFDGVAATARYGDNSDGAFKGWVTAGAFPFEYSSSNFPSFSSNKAHTRDKWIFGGQVGGEFQVNSQLSARVAAAYYDYTNVSGELSSPCQLANGNSECSTDNTRPAFLNKGNTLFLIRNIIAPDGQTTVFAQPQYAGLLFKYRLIDINAELKARLSDSWMVTLSADYVRNLGYRRNDICGRLPLGLPITNVGITGTGSTNPCAVDSEGHKAAFLGSPTAWMARLAIGTPNLEKRGEWGVSAAYKRIGSDSMLDSLTDSDFHLGGTNAKGFVLTGNYMLFDNVRMTGRYLSANEISGEPLGIDLLQVDMTMGF